MTGPAGVSEYKALISNKAKSILSPMARYKQPDGTELEQDASLPASLFVSQVSKGTADRLG